MLPDETIVVFPSQGYYFDWYRQQGYPCFCISKSPDGSPTGGRFIRAIAILKGRAKFCLGLLQLVRRVRPDFVYVNTFCNSSAYVAARISRVPVIWHIREADSIILAKGLIYMVRRGLLRTFNGPIVVVSESVASTVRRVHPKSQVATVYNGVELPDVPNPERADREIAIGFSGSILEHKGVHTLIEGFRMAQRHYPQTRLLLAGPVLDDHYYKRLSAMLDGLDDRVRFLGYLPDVQDFYHNIDVFVLPSLGEGFSRSLLEAMACRLPVIASDVGGNREAIEDGISGLLFRAGDPEDLAVKLAVLLSDKALRNALGRNARIRVQERFSLEQYVEGVARIIQDLVSDRRVGEAR